MSKYKTTITNEKAQFSFDFNLPEPLSETQAKSLEAEVYEMFDSFLKTLNDRMVGVSSTSHCERAERLITRLYNSYFGRDGDEQEEIDLEFHGVITGFKACRERGRCGCRSSS